MRVVSFVLAVAIAAPSIRAQSDAAKKNVATLQGTWSMLWGESDGSRFSGVMLTGSKRVAVGNETTVHIGGALFMKANFTVDPAKTPKAIDYDLTGGATAGKKQAGIYDIVGDTVRFCFAEPGVPRPTEFAAPSGSHRMCSAWLRSK